MFIVRVLVIMIRLFRCHLQHSFLLDLHSYHDYHVCITKSVSLAKRRFRRNKDIVMQCFCFCFDAIISAYTEWTFLHSLLTQHIWTRLSRKHLSKNATWSAPQNPLATSPNLASSNVLAVLCWNYLHVSFGNVGPLPLRESFW